MKHRALLFEVKVVAADNHAAGEGSQTGRPEVETALSDLSDDDKPIRQHGLPLRPRDQRVID